MHPLGKPLGAGKCHPVGPGSLLGSIQSPAQCTPFPWCLNTFYTQKILDKSTPSYFLVFPQPSSMEDPVAFWPPGFDVGKHGTWHWEKLLGAEFLPAKCQGAAFPNFFSPCSEFITLMEKKCLKPSVVAQCSLWHHTQQWWKKSKQKCEEPDKTHGKYLVLYKWAQCLCLKCCLSFV